MYGKLQFRPNIYESIVKLFRMTAGCDTATAEILQSLSSDEQLPVSSALDAALSTL